jgi:hypothetical protein
MSSEEKRHRIRPVVEEVVETPVAVVEPESQVVEAPVPVMVETPTPTAAHEPHSKYVDKEHKKGNLKALLFLTLLSALVVGFVSGGVYVYVSGIGKFPDPELQVNNETIGNVTATPTLAPAGTPAPVVEENVDVSTLSVNILNGSGISGEAGRARAVIEGAGFKVGSVGNATKYDYKETVVQVKASVKSTAYDKLVEALEEKYVVEKGDNLAANGSFDILITVGSSQK